MLITLFISLLLSSSSSLSGLPGWVSQTVSCSTPAQPDAAKLAPAQLLDLGEVIGLNLLQGRGDLHGGLLDFLPLAGACPLPSSHATAHHQPAPPHTPFFQANMQLFLIQKRRFRLRNVIPTLQL